eukprot:6004446-Pyramimonas_sp.AAC.1
MMSVPLIVDYRGTPGGPSSQKPEAHPQESCLGAWGSLGSILEALGLLDACWGLLSASRGPLEALLGALGALFGPSWTTSIKQEASI